MSASKDRTAHAACRAWRRDCRVALARRIVDRSPVRACLIGLEDRIWTRLVEEVDAQLAAIDGDLKAAAHGLRLDTVVLGVQVEVAMARWLSAAAVDRAPDARGGESRERTFEMLARRLDPDGRHPLVEVKVPVEAGTVARLDDQIGELVETGPLGIPHCDLHSVCVEATIRAVLDPNPPPAARLAPVHRISERRGAGRRGRRGGRGPGRRG